MREVIGLQTDQGYVMELTPATDVTALSAFVWNGPVTGTMQNPDHIWSYSTGSLLGYAVGTGSIAKQNMTPPGGSNALSSAVPVCVFYVEYPSDIPANHIVSILVFNGADANACADSVRNHNYDTTNIMYSDTYDNAVANGNIQTFQVDEWDDTPIADGNTTDNNFGGEFADLDPFDMTENQSISDIINDLGFGYQTGLDPYDANGGCGFFTPYVLSQAQLTNLGNILFSSSMWNTISQWFSGLENPMDGFLRCLDFPCTLPTGGAFNISICGQELYYASAGGGTQYAQGHHLTSRYKDVNIGSVTLKEVWGTAVDYTDTEIQIYLPFVGIRELDPKLCVGRTLTLLLRIDCWTGDILYILHVDNDNIGGKWFRSATYCYRWTGNCASEIPIGRRDSSKGLSEILTGLAITAGGAISGNPAVAVGTALYGTATMMKGGLHKGIQSSGTLTGNSGAVDLLYPYLIVQRAVPNYPSNWRDFIGATKGQTYKGSDLSGYTLFDTIHLEDMEGASEEEINELERVLTTEGIIL